MGCSCCWTMRLWSCSGIYWFENWSRCVHISRAERPRERMRELRVAVATDRVTGDTGPPSGSCRSNSFSTS